MDVDIWYGGLIEVSDLELSHPDGLTINEDGDFSSSVLCLIH